MAGVHQWTLWVLLGNDSSWGATFATGRLVIYLLAAFVRLMHVLDLATGRQLQKVELDSPIAGSPAVAGGRLLIGTTKGTMYCLGAK